MSRVFRISELLRVAVADEHAGRGLYNRMADRARDSRLKQHFLSLADQEAYHARKFAQVLARLESEPESPAGDEQMKALEEITVRAGRKAGDPGDELDGSDTGLVERAIRFEQEQLALQREMSVSIQRSYRPVIDMIIKEEQDHLTLLTRELARLKKSLPAAGNCD
jgi:rubrerythrin